MPISKLSLDDCVFNCLSERDSLGGVYYWTFWGIQARIKEQTGQFYGEPSISAAIRNIRKPYARKRYGLPNTGEVITKRRKANSKGYEYKLTDNAIGGK